MNINEQLRKIADEFIGEKDNDNRAVVLLTVEVRPNPEKEGMTDSILQECVQGNAGVIIDAFQHLIEDTSKENQLGRCIRKAQSRAELHHLLGTLERIFGDEKKSDTEKETAAQEQGKEDGK